MTRKSVLYALAVVALTGAMAATALAGYDWAAGAVKPDPAVSALPEQGMDQQNSVEIREPMETGSVPDQSVDSSDQHSTAIGDEPAVEYGGQSFRTDVDTGP